MTITRPRTHAEILNTRSHDPIRDLWAEVLIRAGEEAIWGPRSPADLGAKARQHVRVEAILFCTGDAEWAEARAAICELVDIDPEAFRRAMVRKLLDAEQDRKAAEEAQQEVDDAARSGLTLAAAMAAAQGRAPVRSATP